MNRALENIPTADAAAVALNAGNNNVAAMSPARLILSRRVGGAVLVFIDYNGAMRLIRATHADQPELSVLPRMDRALVQSAVLAMHQSMHGGPNETEA